MITVREITPCDAGSEELLTGLRQALLPLLPQLNPTMRELPAEMLREVIRSPYCHLLVAEDEGRTLGMLTLALYPTLTALRGWVEDVVVDEGARRRGVGRLLLRRAMEIARNEGCKNLSLTSSHYRREAHALYRAEGFRAIDTQPFRLNFE